MCNKIGYLSKSIAKADAKLIRVSNKFRGKRSGNTDMLKEYFCFYCCQWHLTKQSQFKWNKRK